MRPRLARALGSVAVPLFVAAPAFPQTRPLQTESAATRAAGSLVLELGGDLMRDEPNFLTGRERTRWDAPLFRLVWSPADNAEVDLEWIGRVGARHDADFGSVSDYGDVTLRAKYRFVEGGAGRPSCSARFSVSLPETSSLQGLGPNALRMSAQFLLTQELGAARLHANAGLAIHDEVLRPHEQRDFLAYGVALEHELGERAGLIAELAGLAGNGMPGADARHEARAGLRWRTGRLVWDAALRRGLGEADGTWGVTAGLAWMLREGG